MADRAGNRSSNILGIYSFLSARPEGEKSETGPTPAQEATVLQARCPSCAAQGNDKSGDNLGISVEEPRKYCCWAGCTKEMIRAAVGRPISDRRLA
jgi:hypothetical protein